MYRDGGALTFLDGGELPNPLTGISADFPASTNYHYTVLADGCVGGVPSMSADVKYYLSAGGEYKNYEGGYFTDDVQLPNDFNYGDNLRYLDEVDSRGSTVLSDLSSSTTTLTNEERRTLEGKLYVKNGTYSSSEHLSSALKSTISKYSQTVQDQINNELLDFDIIQNTIFLETKSGLLVDKIKYVNGEFKTPTTVNTYYDALSDSNTDTFTNRFYNEKTGKVYFAKFHEDGECTNESGNYTAFYPSIYEYDIANHKTRLLYPRRDTGNSVSDFELNDLDNTDRNYVVASIHTPKIAYNSRNDLFKVTYIANDMNDLSHIVDVSFKMVNNSLSAIDSNRYEPLNNIVRTTSFGPNSNFGQISATGGSFTNNLTSFSITV